VFWYPVGILPLKNGGTYPLPSIISSTEPDPIFIELDIVTPFVVTAVTTMSVVLPNDGAKISKDVNPTPFWRTFPPEVQVIFALFISML
jgi:hypothetical protein